MHKRDVVRVWHPSYMQGYKPLADYIQDSRRIVCVPILGTGLTLSLVRDSFAPPGFEFVQGRGPIGVTCLATYMGLLKLQ